MTIQMKATEPYYPVLLFIYRAVQSGYNFWVPKKGNLAKDLE